MIPADNSCLFNAVAYALEGGAKDRAGALRTVVGDAVCGDKERWCEATLGQPAESYARWITNAEHWGGGIELAVLAEHYATELVSMDVQTKRCDYFGQGNGYTQRVFLVYDGIQ